MSESRTCCGPSCCGGSNSQASTATIEPSITDEVRARYGAVANSGLSNDHDGVRAVAQAFGYTPEELGSIPAEANMGLSCGNPTAFASLRRGEVVVDLGCGGGLDVFLAAQKVGPTGKAIGIDMTAEMIELAKKNTAKANMKNVEFHHTTIDRIPLPDASVDVIISNCVINLAPDKPAVFREIARILKPGGRVAVSDIALRRPLPPQIASDVQAYIGCIAGAVQIDQYRQMMIDAGLRHVQVIDSGADLNAYAALDGKGCCEAATTAPQSNVSSGQSGCCGSSVHEGLAGVLEKTNVNDYAASVRVYAIKT